MLAGPTDPRLSTSQDLLSNSAYLQPVRFANIVLKDGVPGQLFPGGRHGTPNIS